MSVGLCGEERTAATGFSMGRASVGSAPATLLRRRSPKTAGTRRTRHSRCVDTGGGGPVSCVRAAPPSAASEGCWSSTPPGGSGLRNLNHHLRLHLTGPGLTVKSAGQTPDRVGTGRAGPRFISRSREGLPGVEPRNTRFAAGRANRHTGPRLRTVDKTRTPSNVPKSLLVLDLPRRDVLTDPATGSTAGSRSSWCVSRRLPP